MPNPATHTVPSFCRNCTAYCPILVTVEGGRAVKVVGDPFATAYDGYTCPKGRDLPAQHNAPGRLLRCMRRQPDGSHVPITSGHLLDEISGQLLETIDRHGPRSVAVYYGTGNVTNPAGSAMARSWLTALGSDLIFSAMAIDKPAANIAIALHGQWHAGAQAFETSDTWLIVGANPVIAKSNGAPMNNPAQRLKDAVERGMKLIVVDPRRTETARRAHVHLQLIPGEDPTLLAGIIHVILAENLHDPGFVAKNAEGLETLRQAVAPFTPVHVAQRAGVAVNQLLEAARTFARARRGGVVCATGASFSTHGNLTFYLGLCLNTICGRWAREGERAPYPNVLLPPFQPRAEPYPPYPVFGKGRMRVRGMRESASGMPTALLPEEILLGGEGQIKALICLGGNPMLSWPDQARTEKALKSLDLLVVLDTQMTETARLADFVAAVPMSLETAGSTSRVEALKYVGVARGFSIPWAQYTERVVAPSPGSDLVEDASFFFRLAQRMGLVLSWTNTPGYRMHVEGPSHTVRFDMTREPTNEELIELTCANSRVPLAEVRKFPHGRVFDEVDVKVAARAPDCTARLQLADPLMIGELAQVLRESPRATSLGPRTHLLTSRRINKVMNSMGHQAARGIEGEGETPGFLNPVDFQALGLTPGDLATVASSHGDMRVRLYADDSLRPGVVSVIHGFGDTAVGSTVHRYRSVTRLIDMEEMDPITGIPRLSALPVSISPARAVD